MYASTTYDDAMMHEYKRVMPNTAVLCPACKGGQSGEKTFRVTEFNNVVRGKCFRASCDFYWRDYVNGIAPANDSQLPKLNPYTGPIRGLDDAEKNWMKKRYGFELRGVGSTDDGRYVLPIWDDQSAERGVVLRIPHEGSPLREGRDYRMRPKTMTHRSVPGPALAWYRCTATNVDRDSAVLVEDQISAQKVRYYAAVTAVALLGTDLSQDKVAELQRNVRRIVLALDADATTKAFDLARRWGKAFERFNVLILERDVKDSESGQWLPALSHLLA